MGKKKINPHKRISYPDCTLKKMKEYEIIEDEEQLKPPESKGEKLLKVVKKVAKKAKEDLDNYKEYKKEHGSHLERRFGRSSSRKLPNSIQRFKEECKC